MTMPFEVCLIPSDLATDIDSISFEIPFEAVCPVPGKPYGGIIKIEYSPRIFGPEDTVLVEWNSFSEWVKTLRGESLLAEKLLSHVIREFVEVVRPNRLLVEISVNSAFHLPVTLKGGYHTFDPIEGVLESTTRCHIPCGTCCGGEEK